MMMALMITTMLVMAIHTYEAGDDNDDNEDDNIDPECGAEDCHYDGDCDDGD